MARITEATSNEVTTMSVTPAEFWDRVAPKYSQQPISDTDSYNRKLAATQALMRPDMHVLELGCGTGSTALMHAPHVASITASDVSAAMCAIGREKAEDAGIENVTFLKAGVDEIPEDRTYDMVLALNLLHLLPNREAAVSKIHRMLKPGGIFVSSTVCLADRMWFLRPVIPVMQWLGKAPYVSFTGEDAVRREVANAGFEITEQWTHGRANSLFLIAVKHQG